MKRGGGRRYERLKRAKKSDALNRKLWKTGKKN